MRRRSVRAQLAAHDALLKQCVARLNDYDVALATIGIGRHRRGHLELVPDHAEAG
jgi:hypothetical protein